MAKTSKIGNLALAGYNEIFKSSTTVTNGKCIVEIPLSELHPLEYHPCAATRCCII